MYIPSGDDLETEDAKHRGNFSIQDTDGNTNSGEDITEVQQNFSRERQKIWDLNYQEAAIYLQEGRNNDKFSAHPRYVCICIILRE